MKTNKLIILLILISKLLYPQSEKWIHFDVLPVKSFNFTNCIEQDSSGNIWFGTSNSGLLKYDWHGWTNYRDELTSVKIWGIDFDSLNNIWLATTTKGLLYFDTSTNTIADSLNILKYTNHANANHCWDVKIDKFNNIWVGTYWGGLLRFDGSDWINYNAHNSQLSFYQEEVVFIEFDKNDNVWCATDYGGIFMFDRDSNFVKYDSLNWYTSLTIDNNNTIWATGNNFAKIEEGKDIFRFQNSHPPWLKLYFGHQTVKSDGHGNIWIAGYLDYIDSTSDVNGIIKYDDEQFHAIPNKLHSNISYPPRSIYIDQYSNIWMSLYAGQIAAYNENGIQGIPTSLNETTSNTLPSTFKLGQNYPNPFNPSTKIKYTIAPLSGGLPAGKAGAGGGLVTIKIFDILGREIQTLVNKTQTPGNYEVEFDGSRLASGVYFYQLSVGSFGKAAEFISTKKMILIK